MDWTSESDAFELEVDDRFEHGLEDDDNPAEGAVDLETLSEYEVGGIGELEVPDDDELDEPWEVDGEEDISEGGTFHFESDAGFGELGDYENDDDDEEIFGFIKKIGRGLGKLVKKGARALGRVVGPLFKKLGGIAARIVGGAIGGPAGAAIGGTLANAILREGEMESENDTDSEFERNEHEFEAIGGDIEVYEAMQDEAEDMAEADSERRVNRGFVRLARNATRLFARNRRLSPVLPHVMRAALALVKTFRRNRKTRWAIRAIPLIIRRTLTRLARARKIDRRAILVAMSRETAWVLANRRRATLALGRVRSGRQPRRRRRIRRSRPNREVFLY